MTRRRLECLSTKASQHTQIAQSLSFWLVGEESIASGPALGVLSPTTTAATGWERTSPVPPHSARCFGRIDHEFTLSPISQCHNPGEPPMDYQSIPISTVAEFLNAGRHASAEGNGDELHCLLGGIIG